MLDRTWADGTENAGYVNIRRSVWLVFRLGTATAANVLRGAMDKAAGIVRGIGRLRLGMPFELQD